MVEAAFDHRLRTGLAVFLQQVPLQAARVDADADRTAVIPRGRDHLAHALGRADVARVDPQAGGAGLCRLDGAAVVEVDVGDDRHRAFAHDLGERGAAGLVGNRDADDVCARLRRRLHLRDRRGDVGGGGVGHGLDADRGIAAHGDVAHHDLAGGAAVDVPPRTDVVQRHEDSRMERIGADHTETARPAQRGLLSRVTRRRAAALRPPRSSAQGRCRPPDRQARRYGSAPPATARRS